MASYDMNCQSSAIHVSLLWPVVEKPRVTIWIVWLFLRNMCDKHRAI